jgi:ribosomal subunit interface protein
MRVTVTARHCDVPDDLRLRAHRLIERVARLARRPQDGHVVFVAENGRPAVEVRLRVARGEVRVATAAGADHRTALDRAVAKVRRQLDKAGRRRRAAAARRAGRPEPR